MERGEQEHRRSDQPPMTPDPTQGSRQDERPGECRGHDGLTDEQCLAGQQCHADAEHREHQQCVPVRTDDAPAGHERGQDHRGEPQSERDRQRHRVAAQPAHDECRCLGHPAGHATVEERRRPGLSGMGDPPGAVPGEHDAAQPKDGEGDDGAPDGDAVAGHDRATRGGGDGHGPIVAGSSSMRRHDRTDPPLEPGRQPRTAVLRASRAVPAVRHPALAHRAAHRPGRRRGRPRRPWRLGRPRGPRPPAAGHLDRVVAAHPDAGRGRPAAAGCPPP